MSGEVCKHRGAPVPSDRQREPDVVYFRLKCISVHALDVVLVVDETRPGWDPAVVSLLVNFKHAVVLL